MRRLFISKQALEYVHPEVLQRVLLEHLKEGHDGIVVESATIYGQEIETAIVKGRTDEAATG